MVKNNSQVVTGGRRRQAVNVEQIARWWNDSRSELRKVTWPTPEQTRNLTLVVVAVCLIMAAFLGLVDLILSSLVKLLLG